MAALRFVAGLVVGWATWTLLLMGGFALLRAVWPGYGLAEPEKAFTLGMLFTRLVIFTALIATTSAVATLVAGNRRVAWVAGAVIFALSVPPHLYPGYIWEDYPAWYHFAYLLLIVPVAVYSGRLVRRASPPDFLGEPAA